MKKNLEKHLTLRERILETIRDAIIKGSLKAGEKVAEPELAERFGISRTPIREAFRQLESEGYLKVIPRKGAVVAAFSEKDIEEFYAIKSILEGYAAKRACENISFKEIEKLETINSKLAMLAEGSDVKQFFKVHNDFHDLFIKAANNEKLYEMINGLVSKFQRLRLASLSIPGRMKNSVEEHEKIIDAFRKKNPGAAEKLVRKNAEYGGKVLMGGDPAATMKPSERSAMLHLDL
ncbi:GntR family transcriptional regulator [Geobacter pelophilus]|jgi:DNA-binding GntR family transcriptional regulator|uniref:GntR family transcriptional regulator n=1 Tax=Geoanaerobacter pelophilus TaxID=60036 RepID=A0AAW4L6S7_9BACT|nr:GntR family transcriptional regulator [Geoanaerobacter pelophilus]MBT0665210.1 GntR family transcriptional regulator [Geoanaerobacter pelophilus]